jgi:hypothetical protein
MNGYCPRCNKETKHDGQQLLDLRTEMQVCQECKAVSGLTLPQLNQLEEEHRFLKKREKTLSDKIDSMSALLAVSVAGNVILLAWLLLFS